MIEKLMKQVQQISEQKKIGIWGTGKKSKEVVEIAEKWDIKISAFFDNDESKWNGRFYEKTVLSPDELSKEWYILIGIGYSPAVIPQLNSMGFVEYEDFIAPLEADYYEALNRCKNAPRVPEINKTVLDNITNKIIKNIPYECVTWFEQSQFDDFEHRFSADELYNKKYSKRYTRKLMEHFFAYYFIKQMVWKKQDIFIDVAGGSSPFAKFLREQEAIQAYSIDLSLSKYSYLDYYLQGDASKMDFQDGSVTAVSIQSSLETFPGDLDNRIIKEISRILKPGGKAFICPLYLHEEQVSIMSPSNYARGLADKDSLEVIRTDCRDALPMSRFYSMEGLQKRLLRDANEWGLSFKIYILPDEIVERDEFVYFKYILEFTKII